MAIIADSGPVFAALDADDPWHGPITAVLPTLREPVIVPFTVIVEVCRLLRRRLTPAHEARFLRSCAAGEVQIEQLTMEDMERAAELVAGYADANIGFVDASVVAVAERLNVTRLLTLDRRDFSLVRPRHCEAFDLLP